MKMPAINKKTLKYGAMSTAITAAFVAAVIIINLIATVFVDRFNLRVDLTGEGVFTMTDTTKEFLSGMETGADIYVMLDEVYFTESSNARDKQVKYLLDQYELNSDGNVSVTYDTDLVNDAEFIGKFSYISAAAGDVVVVSRKQPEDGKITNYRRFSLDDCFTTTSYQSNTYDISKVENNLTSAIMYLNQDETTTVAFTTGHGEAELNEDAVSLIESNIYSTSTVNLAMLSSLDREEDGTAVAEESEEELSAAEQLAAISIMVIYCPRYDFAEEELAMLDTYLENAEKLGKGLMVFYDPTTPHLPNLEAFLAEWGVRIGDGIVYDSERNYMRSDTVPRVYMSAQVNSDINVFSNELYNDISQARLNLCAPLARPLEIVDGYGYDSENQTGGTFGITVFGAISSFPTSGIMETSTTGASDDDVKGSHLVGTLSVKQRVIDNKTLNSSVFVCGSGSFVDSSMLGDSIFANDQVFVELLNYQAQRDVGVVVNAVDITTATLNMSTTQTYIVIGVFLVALPLLAIAAAVFVFIKRRHL